MSDTLDAVMLDCGAKPTSVGGIELAVDYGDVRSEYDAVVGGAGLYHAGLRGVIEVVGRDRTAWLNNLVTNAIKDLPPGQGRYTFATTLKGRILLDANVLVMEDAIWLDIDRRLIPSALAHFQRYHITEDVKLTDRSEEFERLAMLGARAAALLEALGLANPAGLAPLAWTTVELLGRPRMLVRHDFAGVFGAELYIAAEEAAACWRALLERGTQRPAPSASEGSEWVMLRPVGHTAVETARIEAGIPASLSELNEEVLPAETLQLDRAVSFRKGCYLGQEVVERMRAHGALARTLAGLRLSEIVQTPATIHVEGAPVGTLTSACHSYALGTPIGLGYIKTAHAGPGTRVTVHGDIAHGDIVHGAPLVDAEVVPLPFRRGLLGIE